MNVIERSDRSHESRAILDVHQGAKVTHGRPDYAIDAILSGNALVPACVEVALDLPFGDLLHFAKRGVATPQPKMLVVAPLSGHFATLLRSTVKTLLGDHDVYITDWKNARDIPIGTGRFGFDDCIYYLISFLQKSGPASHLLAICQPCVPALAAVALMARDGPTALLTVEGERDDICAVGQTAAAHTLCSSLRPHLMRHHLQPGVGHYGVFSGSKWETQIYPQVRNLVLAMH